MDERFPVTAEYQRRHSDRKEFGGNRVSALERDRYACVACHMTNAEHVERWGCNLTVDHIDGRGRGNPKPNSVLENLQTLCLRCHGKKDSQRTDYAVRNTATGERHGCAKMTESAVRTMRTERAAKGTHYKKLADQYGVGITAVWAICTGRTWKDVR